MCHIRVDIVNFSRLSEEDAETILIDLEEIFFKTSIKKVFQTSLQQSEYYQTWLGFYLESHPAFTLLAVLDGRCVGYIVGSSDSSFDVFCDLYEKYPAHLHINCHPDFQGQGIGTLLMESFLDMLLERNVCGVHLVTTPNAPNVAFYRKMDFSFERVRHFRNRELMFMARKL